MSVNRVFSQGFMSVHTEEIAPGGGRIGRASELVALAGFGVYALAAPHSIAVSWMGISMAVVAWLVRAMVTRSTGLKRTALDVPLWLFFGWTVLSSLFSAEPGESLAKLVNVSTFLMLYLTQSMLTRRRAVLLAALLIASGTAGVLWGAGELLLGRGVIVSALGADSPLRAETLLREGDAVWRVNDRRVASVEEIDDAIRRTPVGARASLSVISHGEHVEWPGAIVREEMRRAPSPSGITGGGRTHIFRASGWTRHYETFAEMLQIIAQFALGLALAGWRRRETEIEHARPGPKENRWRVWLPAIAFVLLATGIALTAMRTTLVAFAIGAIVLGWRAAARGRQRAAVALVIMLVLALGALAVWRTRAGGALELKDASASLRAQVARVVASRVMLHPAFGHGMDAVHKHWNEWGFPGSDMLHAHSTPLQLAFDRGLPALLFWLWLMYVFWRLATRAERMWRDAPDAGTHGIALGITGALAGFFASSVVNYNFGDSEVALLVWWMMGVLTLLNEEKAG